MRYPITAIDHEINGSSEPLVLISKKRQQILLHGRIETSDELAKPLRRGIASPVKP